MAMSRSLGATSFISLPSMYSSPAGDLFQTCDHAQRGGLAAAGRADENDELAVGNVQVEILNG